MEDVKECPTADIVRREQRHWRDGEDSPPTDGTERVGSDQVGSTGLRSTLVDTHVATK